MKPDFNSMTKIELTKFRKSLQRSALIQQLSQFHKLSYPAPSGAADYIGMTISSRFGTTSYVDMVQDRLPKPLQLKIAPASIFALEVL